jgi:2-polyprenyl-3-methyl-5-hydroxy-6-metoxy-1,4-benzoquinol methylase
MQKQVNKDHYDFSKYVKKPRWVSLWHQLDEVDKLKPNKILEIGPGPGLFKATASTLGMNVETLDIDPDLKPDHVGSVFEMPFENDSFDVVCAFQMLEHIQYEQSLVAFKEMCRVADECVIISLPDCAWIFKSRIIKKLVNFTQLKRFIYSAYFPVFMQKKHIFDGQHYWELNKKNYELKRVCEDLSSLAAGKFVLKKTFRVSENPYHRFFVFVN